MKARRSSRGADRGCESRRALVRWIDKGGPLPPGLADHAAACAKCHRWAARIARADSALMMLSTEAAPVGLLGRANEKGLRMLARKLREDQQAARLRRAKPPVSLWARLEGPLGRTAAAAAAAMIILSLRAGVATGMKQTRDLAQPLADAHYHRHIDDQNMLA